MIETKKKNSYNELLALMFRVPRGQYWNQIYLTSFHLIYFSGIDTGIWQMEKSVNT